MFWFKKLCNLGNSIRKFFNRKIFNVVCFLKVNRVSMIIEIYKVIGICV